MNLDTNLDTNAMASNDSVKAIENDREFKAHIYQQLVDLQPYLSSESQIAVLIQVDQDEETEETEYALTLVATLGEYRLEAEGRENDIYLALGSAKRNLLHQLDEVYGAAIDSKERDAEIRTLMQGGLTIH